MDPYPSAPPPYREDDPKLQQHNANSGQFRIARKPVSIPISRANPTRDEYGYSEPSVGVSKPQEIKRELHEVGPNLPPRPELSLDTTVPANITNSELYLSPLQTRTSTTVSSVSTPGTSLSTTSSILTPTPSSASSQSSTSAYVQKAYKEARHFAGGLISHPYEHTKHYSILRHSHGLVFYQGSSTTLAVSIFADAPLPDDRTIWLQSKGWTGKTGMRAKAFVGRNGNWLNVTPSAEVRPEQLKPDDERAWQRDIAKFRKKADRHVRDHIIRETVLARIPAEAGDGYFQLVLCLGDKKKVLCPSPVFRILSTSASPHSIKGASLTTLPLELGAMVLGTYARNTVGNVVSPVTSIVQSQAQRYMPSWTAQEAVSVTYRISGASKRIDSTISGAENQYDQVRDRSFAMVGGEEISLDQGPGMPYPIHFIGRCDSQSNESAEFTLPKIRVTRVSDDTYHKLHGYYFGWARVVQREKSSDEDIWHQAMISSLTLDTSQLARASIAEASKRFISVSLICDYESTAQDGASIEVQIMGFLRPDEPSQRAILYKGLQAGDEAALEAAMLSEVNDISMTQSILDHPAWTLEALRERNKQQRPGGLERVKTGYANTRIAAQRHIDRVPLHKLGVRMPIDQMRDEAILTNGFYVIR
ncbi:hypothetical protein N431DRAFT_447566 [Stipitochalara longipes BDJ]|nr:hypothetical protein N431DRAFT_447566 [Stipitochalara longipes BDJ]